MVQQHEPVALAEFVLDVDVVEDRELFANPFGRLKHLISACNERRFIEHKDNGRHAGRSMQVRVIQGFTCIVPKQPQEAAPVRPL